MQFFCTFSEIIVLMRATIIALRNIAQEKDAANLTASLVVYLFSRPSVWSRVCDTGLDVPAVVHGCRLR